VIEWEANLFIRQVPEPREIVSEVGTLEDPDKRSPIHMRKKYMRLYHFDTKEGKCDSETVSSV